MQRKIWFHYIKQEKLLEYHFVNILTKFLIFAFILLKYSHYRASFDPSHGISKMSDTFKRTI